MGSRNVTRLIASVALIACMMVPAAAMASTRLTTSSAADYAPAIYGTKVAYMQYRFSSGLLYHDVYLYDLKTKARKRVSTGRSYAFEDFSGIAISGSRIAYSCDRNDNWDVWSYDLSTSRVRRVTSNSSVQYYPDIYGTKIVWEDQRNGNTDVYLYDLATGVSRRLTMSAADQYQPAIYGNRVVYQDTRHDEGDVYLYDLLSKKETRITTNAAWQGAPDIWGTRIVYADQRGGNSDIYLYDLATRTERRLTTSIKDQWAPAISGNNVVYTDNRNGNADIYCYDLVNRSERRMTTSSADQYSAAINGTKVVWEDKRNGKSDVYYSKIPPTVTTPVAPATMYKGVGKPATGYLKPRHTAGTSPVRIYRWKKTATGSWKAYGYTSAKVTNYSTYSKYAANLIFPERGSWRIRAYHPECASYAAKWSARYDYVTVK